MKTDLLKVRWTISSAWNELTITRIATTGNENIVATLITHQVLEFRVMTATYRTTHLEHSAKFAGKPTCRQHAHMHTREEVGIAVETTQDLEASFAWAPPLSTEPRDANDLLAVPESILPDDITAEFAALEELKRTEELQNIKGVEVLEGNTFDFDELDRVEQGIIPQAILGEVEVVNYNGKDERWDEAKLMSSLGMSYTKSA
ncbi:uncharacterized protein BJ212DRAFT_1364402 [Suillus subaureus]|uniref:Uncharacterized protein n=1 Tax=Suillus subaureus TaxID=48587 RepID=A0A9P7E8Z2_9AGAM|nr:uncharacterized protein BJ212DRAFT_1364402 [Suillus subaureus]KAG1813904.1 hypothetical protein BJ212DRAFT_1364402 [Suillus subaureus]